MTKPKDLMYWKNRGGQIEWRLADAESVVLALRADLKECDENIRILSIENADDTNRTTSALRGRNSND